MREEGQPQIPATAWDLKVFTLTVAGQRCWTFLPAGWGEELETLLDSDGGRDRLAAAYETSQVDRQHVATAATACLLRDVAVADLPVGDRIEVLLDRVRDTSVRVDEASAADADRLWLRLFNGTARDLDQMLPTG